MLVPVHVQTFFMNNKDVLEHKLNNSVRTHTFIPFNGQFCLKDRKLKVGQI